MLKSSYPAHPKLCSFFLGLSVLFIFIDAHHELRIIALNWDCLSTLKKKKKMFPRDRMVEL